MVFLPPTYRVFRSRPLRRGWAWRLVVEDEESSAGREPSLCEAARPLGGAMKEADADREDLVEAAVSEVEVFEVRDEELALPAST
jgi:hypothetical protein